MTDRNFMRVEDVARELDVSKSYAYKIVQKLNKELEAKGYITISGRVNKQYFLERTCYGGSAEDSERPAIKSQYPKSKIQDKFWDFFGGIGK